MDCEITCNFRKCRKPLKTQAWVTSCSHVFCDDDGSREFRKSKSCPACETSLTGRYDTLKIDLQPSEQYKSMVLAGQSPDTIMDICTRALTFWTYQVHQERSYQEYVNAKQKERSTQLEQYYEQLVTRTTSELNSVKAQCAATKKELETLKKNYSEAQDKAMDKNRQYQKLQSMYDSLRIKLINPGRYSTGGDHPSTPNQHGPHGGRTFELQHFVTADDILRHGSGGSGDAGETRNKRPPATPERDFVLRPTPTPVTGSASDALTGPGFMCRFGNGTPRMGGYRKS